MVAEAESIMDLREEVLSWVDIVQVVEEVVGVLLVVL
jgi:hypothetical protein